MELGKFQFIKKEKFIMETTVRQFLLSTVSLEDDKKKSVVVDFWSEFYQKSVYTVHQSNHTNRSLYKDKVYEILHEFKRTHIQPYSKRELIALQSEIESTTIIFDEKSIHASSGHIMKYMIDPKKESAKDFVYERLTSSKDQSIISDMGQYTLEAIIVYVISKLYSSESEMIRVSTLIDQLDKQVKAQSVLENKHKKPLVMKEVGQNVALGEHFPIGAALVEFISDRGLMTIQHIDDRRSSVPIQKKKGKYYMPKLLYAFYNFDVSLLPVKLNIPMVYPPIEWSNARNDNLEPKTLYDLKGGYLSGISEVSRYHLLSSWNYNNYYIDIESGHESLCAVMNKLQKVPFRIASFMLTFINENYNDLVKAGLLMPKALCIADMKKLRDSLREFYMNNEKGIKTIYSYDEVLTILYKDVQRARFERVTLMLSEALEGFKLYLPAFLDFRGRIYRSGILHFHERDLVRSLLIFDTLYDGEGPFMDMESCLSILRRAIPYYWKSFSSYTSSEEWGQKLMEVKDNVSNSELIQFSVRAKKPFQMLASVCALRIEDETTRNHYLNYLPITQDASSSAYQIMGFLLLDTQIAIQTNLISENKGAIHDIYNNMKELLLEYIESSSGEYDLSENLKGLIIKSIDRKLVKALFMPIIYGKTVISTATDLRTTLSKFVTKGESMILAKICFAFWRKTYRGMDCLINLIKSIGWMVSARGSHVRYQNKIYTTVQKYMKMDAVKIWIYDRENKKKRQVTLRVSTDKNDKRKSEIATFVNFIHQFDAFIAMSVIYEMPSYASHIYTVHDNFITIPYSCDDLPDLYKRAFCRNNPLEIINRYIYTNVMEHLGMIDGLTHMESKHFQRLRNNDGYDTLIIHESILSKYLICNMPKNLKRKIDTQTWEGKINTIITSYKEYVATICRCESPGKDYDINKLQKCHEAYTERYQRFIMEIMRGSTNYSIHH